MSVLEDKIRKNRERYDVHEPAAGHLERFEAKLDEAFPQKITITISWKKMLRYAAAIILVAGLSAILTIKFMGGGSAVQADPVDEELAQVIDHYNRLTDQKLNQINSCAQSGDEAVKIDEMAKAGIAKLDQDAQALQQELEKNNNNQRILDALVNNYRTRIKLLDNILIRICEL